MATSTKTNLDNLVIHKVNTYKTWADNYNQTNGIGVNDLVIIPPSFLLPRPFNSSTGVVDNGTSGQFLKTNGNGTVEWANVVALPTQDSNTVNKFLKSNGASGAQWADVVALPIQNSSTNGQFLKSNGENGAAWATLPEKHFIWFGECNTEASTVAKTVMISGITELAIGLTIHVKFSNGNTASNPTLNVNSLGAINTGIVSGSNTGQYHWISGEIVNFTYDGTRWIMINEGVATTTYYGVTKLSSATNSTSTSLAATPAAVKSVYDLANTASNNVIQLQDDFKEISGVLIQAPGDGIYAYEVYALSTDGDIYQCVNSAGTSEAPGSNSSSWSLVGSDLISMITSKITYGTTDLTAGTSDLETGTIYVCYE